MGSIFKWRRKEGKTIGREGVRGEEEREGRKKGMKLGARKEGERKEGRKGGKGGGRKEGS